MLVAVEQLEKLYITFGHALFMECGEERGILNFVKSLAQVNTDYPHVSVPLDGFADHVLKHR